MKIAVVFDQMIFGGIERVGISHIKLLKDLGHEVDAYVLSKYTEPIIDELKELCSVKIVPFSRMSCSGTYWNATRRFKGGVFMLPILLIIVGIYRNFQKIWKKQIKKYDVAIAFSGHFNDLSFVSENFIKSKKKIAWLHGALYQYIITSQGFEYYYKKIKNLVTLVDDAQEEVFAYHMKNKFNFNIKKIYNPIQVDAQAIDSNKVTKLREEYGEYLVMVSRMLYPHKDHYTVIEAIKILLEKYGINKKVLFVGDGPEREKIERFTADNGMQDNVVFIGSQKDVGNYYAGAFALVHASVAGEGLPTVILEGMSYNIPVISTDSKVGPREILGDNEFGLLSKVKSPEDMALKIYNIVSNPKLYEKLVKNGKKRLECFSSEIIKTQVKMFLEELE
ncbi:glycosyltransferase [Acholeplasma sp. OttesenSCG-928-E16]|nr:glycosyltransferase [Acholeplasma sp. OttesenSCG-928-E16]